MNQSCIQGQKKIDNERNKTQSWKLKVESFSDVNVCSEIYCQALSKRLFLSFSQGCHLGVRNKAIWMT